MLRFQWDSLRRGDTLFVHDAARPDLGLRPAEVAFVDSDRSNGGVSVRYLDGDDAGRLVRPTRFSVHVDPTDEACWRCEDLAS
jgi:hypothetical protein